ncbi:DNA adenine methylase [Herbaspirillum rubrisubalbicans]|uniref:DNA adenine methylase n=1 Tax=Herbaspirillum rubrisubalbicans TaxID=80842 RepID=UPI0020A1B7B5|nr:DNA adenine methylase [Herbaspirillum rubrisubalbicans]MCP1571952.1 DNA adenine methylase [Herbaspirillum rubrisubalbicans]
MKKAPHVIPYQGSKRKLAEDILSYMDVDIEILYEPFVGSGAITLAAAANNKAKKFVVADKLEPLAELWKWIVTQPERLTAEYATLWNEQLSDPAGYYRKVRDDFNQTQSPSDLLYLVARCVKNAVRFNGHGQFNQGPDNRRLGLKPDKLKREVALASKLLKGRVKIVGGDFRDAIADATPDDLVYMDPPWQGTSGKRDPRYAYLLNLDELIEELDSLNKRNVPYMLSFDGTCGDRSYGAELPGHLQLQKVALHAGRSSQATLLGRDDVTIESLYLSPALMTKQKTAGRKKKSRQLDLLGTAAN